MALRLKLVPADKSDAEAIALLRTAAANHLTEFFGQGHWSAPASAAGVLNRMRRATVLVVRRGRSLAGIVTLGTVKPWAIDPTYFTAVRRPLYLTDMAVAPALQGQGVGRWCLDQIEQLARAWPAEAIRLDAYDATAGAGEFYRKCGYRQVGRVVYRNTPLRYYERVF